MTDNDTTTAADVNQLIEQIRNGDRNLSDAEAIDSIDGLQATEVTHEAANGERVVLHYNFYTAFQSTGEGTMEEIDIFNSEQ